MVKFKKGGDEMDKVNKIFLTITIILAIALCVMTVLYFNLKSDYKKLQGDFLFSQNGENLEKNNLDGDFLFSEEGK